MWRHVRRPLLVLAVGGTGVAVRRAALRRSMPRAVGGPVWPPIELDPTPTQPTQPQPTPTAHWVEAADGTCPLEHPIKANDRSMIFHVPGGRSYERTRAQRCYADPEHAAADGYRAAKV